jgi:hypothetical protein
MMQLVKILSTSVDKLGRLVPKFIRFGQKDAQTSIQAAPSGIDSNPIKDMVAVYSSTSEIGKTVILGYFNRNVLAQIGEIAIYSVDASGTLKAYVWAKNNGEVLLNGDENGGLIKIASLKDQYDTNMNGLKLSVETALQAVDAQLIALGQPGGSKAVFTAQYNATVSELDRNLLENTKVIH